MDKNKQLEKESVSKLIFLLSTPAIISLLTNSVNMAIDRVFIAQGVGTLALSAVTIAFGVYLLMQACSQLIGTGASSLIAIQLGRKNKVEGEKIIGNAFTMSLILAVVITFFGILFLNPLLKLYGANKNNFSYTREYALVMLCGAICFVLAQSMNSIVRGMGYAKRSLINFAASIIVNLILDAVFIFLFHWGVMGAALATVSGNLLCAILAIKFLCSKNNAIRIKYENLRLQKKVVNKIMSIGISGFIGQFALSIVTLVFNHICIVYGGNITVAAYGIISTLFMLVYMPLIGLGQGIQSIIGYNYGAENYDRVKKVILKVFLYATCFCIIMFVLFESFSPQIISVFGGKEDPHLAEITVKGMRIYGLMLPVVGIQMVGANFFQYIGKVKQSMLLSALRQILFLIPLVLIFPAFMGVMGIWSAVPVSDFASFIITGMFVYKQIKAL